MKNSLSNISVSPNKIMPWYWVLGCYLHTYDSEIILDFTDRKVSPWNTGAQIIATFAYGWEHEG